MILREAELAAPVAAWLKAAGYTVYSEVPVYYGATAIDLLGKKGDDLITVELKMTWSKGLKYQAHRHTLISENTYAATPTKPSQKTIEMFTKSGIGMLHVKNGLVSVIAKPLLKYPPIQHYIDYIFRRLEYMEPGYEGAGHPTLKGVGPAIECRKRVDEYLRIHPTATWKQIFQDVHNHYSSYKSMYAAMIIRTPATAPEGGSDESD